MSYSFISTCTNLANSSCHSWKHKSVFLQVFHQSSVPSNITPLYFFSSNNIYFDQKELIKVKIFRLSSAQVKICQIPYCQFWNDKLIPYQILYHSSVSWKITPLWVFESKFFRFLMSILKWKVNSPSNFASFFIAMTNNSSLNFKLILFLVSIKGSPQSPNIDTFKCSDAIFFMSFSKQQVFLQILYDYSVSWKITPLYLFKSNIKYLTNFWDFRELRSKFTKFLSFLKQQTSFLSNFASIFRVMRHNSSLLF